MRVRALFIALRVIVAVAIIAAVVGQLLVSLDFWRDSGVTNIGSNVANFFSFFTVDANIASAVVLLIGAGLAVAGRSTDPDWFAEMTQEPGWQGRLWGSFNAAVDGGDPDPGVVDERGMAIIAFHLKHLRDKAQVDPTSLAPADWERLYELADHSAMEEVRRRVEVTVQAHQREAGEAGEHGFGVAAHAQGGVDEDGAGLVDRRAEQLDAALEQHRNVDLVQLRPVGRGCGGVVVHLVVRVVVHVVVHSYRAGSCCPIPIRWPGTGEVCQEQTAGSRAPGARRFPEPPPP